MYNKAKHQLMLAAATLANDNPQGHKRENLVLALNPYEVEFFCHYNHPLIMSNGDSKLMPILIDGVPVIRLFNVCEDDAHLISRDELSQYTINDKTNTFHMPSEWFVPVEEKE